MREQERIIKHIQRLGGRYRANPTLAIDHVNLHPNVKYFLGAEWPEGIRFRGSYSGWKISLLDINVYRLEGEKPWEKLVLGDADGGNYSVEISLAAPNKNPEVFLRDNHDQSKVLLSSTFVSFLAKLRVDKRKI